MDVIALFLSHIVVLSIGTLVGLTNKGITIKHVKETPVLPSTEAQTYNQSTHEMLPDEVRDYLEKNNGMLKL